LCLFIALAADESVIVCVVVCLLLSFIETVLAASINWSYLYLAVTTGSFVFESTNYIEFLYSRVRCFLLSLVDQCVTSWAAVSGEKCYAVKFGYCFTSYSFYSSPRLVSDVITS